MISNSYFNSHSTNHKASFILTVMSAIIVLTFISISPMPDKASLRGTDFAALGYVVKMGTDGPIAVFSPFHTDARRLVPPGYASLIWTLSRFDEDIFLVANCLYTLKADCQKPFAFQLLVALQYIACFGCLVLIFLISWRCCGGFNAALLATILAAVFSRFSAYVTNLQPYIIFSFLFLSFICLMVWAVSNKSSFTALLAGAMLAAVGLFHPPALLLMPIMVMTLVSISLRSPSKSSLPIHLPVVFAIGVIVPLTPLFVHNYNVFGDPLLTVGYEINLLKFRVGFNDMTHVDMAAAWIKWFPFFGSTISNFLFGIDAGFRLEKFEPGSYRYIGVDWLRKEGPVGVSYAQLNALWQHYMYQQPFAYLASSLALFFKHFWLSGSFISLPALYLMPTVFKIASRRKEVPLILVVIAACIGLLAIQAVFDFRSAAIGLPLIVLPCCILAYVTRGL